MSNILPSLSRSTARFWKMSMWAPCAIVVCVGVCLFECIRLIALTPTYSTKLFIRGMLYLLPVSNFVICNLRVFTISLQNIVAQLTIAKYYITYTWQIHQAGDILFREQYMVSVYAGSWHNIMCPPGLQSDGTRICIAQRALDILSAIRYFRLRGQNSTVN